MKLATYNPQVKLNNINGQVQAYGDGGAAQAAAAVGQMQAQGLGGLARGLAVGIGVVQRQQEELDAINAQAATNEYTRRINDVLYNQDNGLMNTKLQAADGITTKFEEAEQQIRKDVGSQYKFNTRKGQMVFQNMMNNSAAQRFELVRKHQTQQFFAYKDVTYANAQDTYMQTAGSNYSSPEIVEDSVKQAMSSAAAHYFEQGEEAVRMQSRKAAGEVALYSINRALAAGDLMAASGLLERYAGVIDQSKLPRIVGNIREQRENNFMAETAMRLARSGLKGRELEQAIENVQTPGATGNYQGLKKMMDATLGQPYKLGTAGGNGTWDCGLWTQTMLNQNGENINTRTADGQFAQMESEGRAFNDRSKLKPGDLVFWHTTDRWKYTDNPNAGADEAYKGITHVGIYVGNGKVRQAGNSGVSDIELDDYKVIGFGSTNMGSTVPGRGLDATQKMRLASMIDTQRAKDKRIEAERQDEMISAAQERFRADGVLADPEEIAQDIAGDDIKMKNTIADMLTAAKYKIEQRGISDGQMKVVFDMIKAGEFESKTQAIQYVQIPGRKANTKQINQIEKWWNEKLNLKGQFSYEHLDQFIKAAVADEKDQSAKLAREIRLRNYAENYINEYRRTHKDRDPSGQELEQALSKDVVNTKMIAQSYDGRTYVYDPLMNADRNIVSAVPYGEGMMKVRFRDDDNKYGSVEVIMPTTQYAQEIGLESENSWLGNAEAPSYDVGNATP